MDHKYVKDHTSDLLTAAYALQEAMKLIAVNFAYGDPTARAIHAKVFEAYEAINAALPAPPDASQEDTR